MRFGFSQRMRIAVALVLGTIVFTACGNDSGKYFGERATPNSPRAVPIAQARREALTLLVYLYDVPTKEFGVGEWSRFEGGEQIHDEPLDCPDGYAAESYSLGAAAPLGKDKWEAAVKRIYEILKPYGFGPPKEEPSHGQAVSYYNPNTGAEIRLGYNNSTSVDVGSGCERDAALRELARRSGSRPPAAPRFRARALHHGPRDLAGPSPRPQHATGTPAPASTTD